MPEATEATEMTTRGGSGATLPHTEGDRLRAAGCNETAALEPLGIGRRTRYR